MPFEINTLLCPIDFSVHSQSVVAYAAELAKRFSSELMIFHSVPITSDGIYSAPDVTKISNMDAILSDVQNRIAQWMSSTSASWKPIIRSGDPVDEIAKVCADMKIDLIIAGSYGLSGLRRFLHGTIIERLARSITCPLWVIPSPKQIVKQDIAISHIVFACDLSDSNPPIIRYLIHLSHFFNSEIHLIHAIESPAKWVKGEIPSGPYEEIQKKQQQEIETLLNSMIPDANRLENKIRTIVTQGVPEEVLAEYVKKYPVDLIVVGVKHHGALNKLLIGATTESILRKASCPVLVIPSHYVDHHTNFQSDL